MPENQTQEPRLNKAPNGMPLRLNAFQLIIQGAKFVADLPSSSQ
jgi:hypothetical protein